MTYSKYLHLIMLAQRYYQLREIEGPHHATEESLQLYYTIMEQFPLEIRNLLNEYSLHLLEIARMCAELGEAATIARISRAVTILPKFHKPIIARPRKKVCVDRHKRRH